MPKKILITGARGLIGSRLTELLLADGYLVSHLGREKTEGRVPSFVWDIKNRKIDAGALEGSRAIIHLAGAGVADKRWTDGRKKEILESRINSTELLFQTLKKSRHSIQSFISASAIGYYGQDHEEKVFHEKDSQGKDFLAQVTTQWEEKVDEMNTLGIRTVKLRTGIVLSEKGGALKKMARPIQWGVGSPLGTGKQMLSWIHMDDLCGMFIHAIENEKMSGAYNAVSNWCTNEEMTKTIAKVLNRPIWLPNVPSFALKMILGEMAVMVLKGSKISSDKITQAGYQFKFPDLETGIQNLLT